MFLQYLWGIETSENNLLQAQIKIVFTVPMRNWNDYMGGGKHEEVIVFTVPMRNWN